MPYKEKEQSQLRGHAAGMMRCLSLVIGLFALLVSIHPAFAKPTTATQAKTVVQHLLALDSRPLKATLGQNIKGVATYYDASKKPLYYVVKLNPSGFIIVSADDTIEPIIAFVEGGEYTPSTSNPLGALVTRDMKARMATIKMMNIYYSSSLKTQSKAFTTAQNKWAMLLATPAQKSLSSEKTANPVDSLSDVRVSPLVQSLWDQAKTGGYSNTLDCYNYYTPNNYVCGCVATAIAQLMRYHQYPTTGVDTQTLFDITVDGQAQQEYLLGGAGAGGTYEWDQMPLETKTSPMTVPDNQRKAIGAICHDAGVAAHMNYTAEASGAILSDASQALTSVFHYSNSVAAWYYNVDISYFFDDMINPNLDAGLPVVLGIADSALQNGHAIVCDGYGFESSTPYYHLNMGWSGSYNAWYNLPTIPTFINFSIVDSCIYNVFPTGGDGEIISGRVFDKDGLPMTGATVTAQSNSGVVYGSSTTNAKGIYAITHVPSSTALSVIATKSGMHSANTTVTTGVSVDDDFDSGNVWGVDFTLRPDNDLAITTDQLPDGQVGVAYPTTTLQATRGTQPYSWSLASSTNYYETYPSAEWNGNGIARLWKDDDNQWALSLPFSFPFYGNSYSTIYVDSNGYITFTPSESVCYGSGLLGTTKCIAPFWTDLLIPTDDANKGIYVTSDTERVIIRWATTIIENGKPVEFEVVLSKNGNIQFNYLTSTVEDISPVIGISNGDGAKYIVSGYNGEEAPTGPTSIIFTRDTSGIAPGLSCNAGVISGTPSVSGTFSSTFSVIDAAGATDTKTFTYTVEPSIYVDTPTFSKESGIYPGSVSVSLSCNTPHATIRYTLDGSTPTQDSALYTQPIRLVGSTVPVIKTIIAKAFKSGLGESNTAVGTYLITPQVMTPTFSMESGTYDVSVTVGISCQTTGAAIYYTTDGTEPTQGGGTSRLYSGALTIRTTTNLKAKAFRNDLPESDIASAIYVINPQVDKPIFTPVPGTYDGSVLVTIDCATPGATIHYTSDNTVPTEASPVYSAPIALAATTDPTTITLRARAFKDGMPDSDITSGMYTITPQVATPTFTPDPGSYEISKDITLACSTPGATIRYTTNGSEPNSSSTVYTGAIHLTQNTTLKAKAFKTGMANSNTAIGVYTIVQQIATPTITPGGSFSDQMSITMSCATPGATIRYTTDGSDPVSSSTVYTGTITLTSTTTVKAKAFKTGMVASDTVCAVYTLIHYHPADIANGTGDLRLTINEVTAYSSAWKSGKSWGGSAIPAAYVTNAGAIWKAGETYRYDSTKVAPLCWIASAAGLTVSPSANTKTLKSTTPMSMAVSRVTVERKNNQTRATVSITITPQTGTAVYAVQEAIPQGWTVLSCSNSGTVDASAKQIRWGLFYDAQPRTITYTLVRAGMRNPVVNLAGFVSVDGIDSAITGVRQIK